MNEQKRLKLIEALREGDIHSLTSLHQPNSDIHKDITFYDAHVGTTSIAEYLPLLYTYLISTSVIDMSRLVDVASRAPGKQIGINAGEISVGSSVDMILFDPVQTTPVTHHHSLYKNETLQGKVIMALCRGEVTRF